jgi:multidrug efflux pump subunit AcrB
MAASSNGLIGTTQKLLTWSMDHRQVVISVSVLTIVSIVPLFMLVGKNFRRPTINHSSTY